MYEPPFFAGMSLAAHLAELRSLLADGKNDEAMRYNLISVIGLPVGAVEEMARVLVAGDGRGRADPGLRPRGDPRNHCRSELAQALGQGHRASAGLLG